MTSLLPEPEQYFTDLNGLPLAGGTILTLIPNSSVPKSTWQDAGQNTVNTNPIVLNSAGRAVIFGDGDYRFVVSDQFGNLIYDALTSSTLPESDISAVMLPVTSAATLEEARDLLGIPEEIAEAIAGISLLPGPTGPTGPAGPIGPTGPQGSAALAYQPTLNGSNPGYLQLPNVNGIANVFIQFGQATTVTTGSVAVLFALGYPNGCLGVFLTPLTTAANVCLALQTVNASGFVATSSSIGFPGGGFHSGVTFQWMSIGF